MWMEATEEVKFGEVEWQVWKLLLCYGACLEDGSL